MGNRGSAGKTGDAEPVSQPQFTGDETQLATLGEGEKSLDGGCRGVGKPGRTGAGDAEPVSRPHFTGMRPVRLWFIEVAS